jgi:hypothetical protein
LFWLNPSIWLVCFLSRERFYILSIEVHVIFPKLQTKGLLYARNIGIPLIFFRYSCSLTKLNLWNQGSVFFFFVFFFSVINLRGVSTNKTIICFIAMQTYKELISVFLFSYLVRGTQHIWVTGTGGEARVFGVTELCVILKNRISYNYWCK